MKETQAFLKVKRQQPQIKNFTNSDLDKLRSRLKAVYSKNILSFEHEKEFLDETASLIPDSLKTNHRLHLTMFASSIRESTTSKSKAFLKFLQETLKDSSELFLYLTVYSAFQNLPYKKYTNDSDEKYLVDLEGSYISSHTIFWNVFRSLRNYVVTSSPIDLYLTLEASIKHVANICIALFIDFNLIDVKRTSLAQKSIEFYSLTISLDIQILFNFKALFSRVPFTILKFNDRLLIEEVNAETKQRLKRSVYFSQTIVSGITHLRVYSYANRHFTGMYPFEVKDDSVTYAYLGTPFFPDIPYISHLKEGIFSYLNITDIRKRLSSLTHKMQEAISSQKLNDVTFIKHDELQRKYSFLMEEEKMWNFLHNDWEDRPYYTIVSHEFRGRKLYPSPYSFTNLRLSRVCFHFGKMTIKPAKYDWSNYVPTIRKITDNCKNNISVNEEEIIFFFLISIGRHNPQMKQQVETPMYSVLEWAVDLFNTKENILYEELKNSWAELPMKARGDALLLDQSKYALECFLNGDRTNRVISKDAVASGFLVAASIVKAADFHKLKAVNISSSWIFVDTYLYIVERFLIFKGESLKLIPPHLLRYLTTRKIAKNFGMLISYSAGFPTAFKKIKSYIQENDIIESERIFKEFFLYIQGHLWEDLGYAMPLKEYIKEWKLNTRSYCVESKTGKADLRYFYSSERTIDSRYSSFMNYDDVMKNKLTKRRKTRQYRSLTNMINTQQMDQALPPNTTHFNEGDPIRILHLPPYNFRFASIHDDYLIPASDCGWVVYSYANIFQMELGIPFQLSPTILK